MRVVLISGALLLAVCASGPTLAQPSADATTAGIVVQCKRMATSTPKLAKLYPRRAERARMSGRAVVGCAISPRGTNAVCDVVEETPAGWEFGEAAENVVARALMLESIPHQGRDLLKQGGKALFVVNWQCR
jgi:outer membrane biosynthesis protein TonB